MVLTAQFIHLPDLAALGSRWQALEAHADGSFFLGWTWLGAWLESYDTHPELLAVTDEQGRDVALALMGHAMRPRLLGRAATISLNQSGDAAADRPFVEYNGLLTQSGREEEVVAVALSAIHRRRDWRVLRLSGIRPGSPLLAMPAHRKIRMDRSPVYQVDLEAVRAVDGDYLSLLSANSRSQIRRAMKDHGGALPSVTRARDTAEADAWLAEMHGLNQGRHADNAWDDPAFRHFLARLTARGMASGEVELVRLGAPGETVGLLVNFVHRGVAMNYQSAFAAPRSPKDKPGLLSHAAAIADYAERGLSLYSLLAGKDRYKQSLATQEDALEWWRIERFTPRLEVEALLRKLLNRPASE